MNMLAAYAHFAADNDDAVSTRSRSHTYHDGIFEQDFEVDPPGLFGLNRLAEKLNDLERSGMIRHWSLGRWKNHKKTWHGVLFGSAQELDAARLAIPPLALKSIHGGTAIRGAPMDFRVTQMELEGPAVIAITSDRKRYSELWQAQNEAERLARQHVRSTFDQERSCWQGSDREGRTFRYVADVAPELVH